MKHIVFLLAFVLNPFFPIYAQDEIEYNNPPATLTDNYELEYRDIISKEDYCKFKLVIKNPSKTNYLVYNTKKTGFEYDAVGIYYPKKGKEIVIEPNKTESCVMKIEDGMDYRVATFHLCINGLMSGVSESIPVLPDLLIETEKSSNADGITITCLKYLEKKGKVTANIEIAYDGSSNRMIEIDPDKITIKAADGSVIDAGLNKNKKTTLLPGEKYKLNLAFESTAAPFNMNTDKVFQIIALSPIAVDKVQVMSPNFLKVATTPNVSSEPIQNPQNASATVHTPNASCEPFQGPKNASVKVKVLNDEGVCFKLNIDGQYVVTQFTNSAIIYLDPGSQKMEFILPNGTTVQKTIYIADIYDVVGYRLKEKKNGEYVINYAAFDQVLNAKGEAARAEMMAKVETGANQHNNNTNPSTINNSANHSTVGGSSSSGQCYGAASSGTTTVKLKITWKGAAVANNDIQIKYGGAAIGNNTTDASGNVSIKTSSLQSKKIDVYGCNGSSNWSVTGDWVVLDGSNYFHLQLDEVAAFMAEMMGMTVEQIGAGWGL